MKGLFIEYDSAIAEEMISRFSAENISLVRAPTEEEALASIRQEPPHFILLDAGGAKRLDEGAKRIGLVQEIRALCDTPIIVFGYTRRKDEQDNTVEALRAGADEFLARTPRQQELLEELLPRVRAVLRRDRTTGPRPPDYRYEGLEHWVGGETRIHGTPVHMERFHTRLMDILVERRGEPISEKQIRELTGRPAQPRSPVLIAMQVSRMRKRFASHSGGNRYIRTQRVALQSWGTRNEDGASYYLPQPPKSP